MLDKSINIHEPQAKRTTNHQPSMADLMANYSIKPVILNKGDFVEGTVISKTAEEALLDLGAKSEGTITKHDFGSQFENLQVGDKIKAFVIIPESESGQVILSSQKAIELPKSGGRFGRSMTANKRADFTKRWQKFVSAKDSKARLQGRVLEVNKGGLMIEVDGIRGFVPSSHLGLSALIKVKDYADMVGQEVSLQVIEVDPGNNRLIFSTRETVNPETKEKLAKFTSGQKVTGKIASVAPFGLVIDLGGVEGLVYSNEISWDETADLIRQFQVGEEIETQILGTDETLGRVNLSLRQLEEDPFSKIAEKLEVDDVITGTVNEINQEGISVKLEGDIDGFLPGEKLEQGNTYEVGQKTNFLIDSIDNKKRRIILAPFLTSTKGLIYK